MRVVLAAIACATAAFALPVTQSNVGYVAMESDAMLVRSGWSMKDSATAARRNLQLTFAVRQQNLDRLARTVLEVSDPTHPSYGQHLSLTEVNELVAPAAESVQAVMSFLSSSNGVSDVKCATSNCDFVTASVSVEDANALINANYRQFQHDQTGHTALATDSYSLPPSLLPHVDFVSPTIRLPAVGYGPTVGAPDALVNTPKSLRELYKVGDAAGTHPSNKQAASAFLEQYFKPTDLQEFYRLFFGAMSGKTIKVVGDPIGSNAGVEASLDVDYISTVGANVTTEFWSFAGRAPDNKENEPFLAFMQLVGSTADADVPHVISTSYGEPEESVSLDYANRLNVEFQKAGARGISLLFASGDSGVGSSCSGGRFVGQWPAGSPWVTAVGGTAGANPEVVAGLSSGGFSDRWAQPSWQASAISTYLKTATGLPDAKLFNATGRGFPDVAAQAVNFVVVNGGIPLPGVSGTSAASPTFSAVVGLLNDVRLGAGKSYLGFLNPLIYSGKLTSGFNDITKGSNPGCGTDGFTAAVGWDPATGFGSPDFSSLSKLVLALP